MNLIKKVIFSTPIIKPNLFIGGVGATAGWTNPAAFSGRITVNVNQIKSFKIKGVDIETNIMGNALSIGSANGAYPITYVIDESGVFVDCLIDFRNSTTIKKAVLLGARNTTGSLFLQATNVEEIIMPNIITRASGLGGFSRLLSVKILDIRRFTMETATQNYSDYFDLINPACVIKINVTNKTSNNGNPAGGLVAAKNRGCTIEFYENGIYHSTL